MHEYHMYLIYKWLLPFALYVDAFMKNQNKVVLLSIYDKVSHCNVNVHFFKQSECKSTSNMASISLDFFENNQEHKIDLSVNH